MIFKIYHNPRCSKSRQTLEILNKAGVEVQIITYLDGVTKSELEELFSMVDTPLKNLIRTKESEFDISVDLESQDQIIAAIVATPKLLERPIVVKGKKAVIGRPPENVNSLL
jgi:arsenate reductase (glutaredoxin)